MPATRRPGGGGAAGRRRGARSVRRSAVAGGRGSADPRSGSPAAGRWRRRLPSSKIGGESPAARAGSSRACGGGAARTENFLIANEGVRPIPCRIGQAGARHTWSAAHGPRPNRKLIYARRSVVESRARPRPSTVILAAITRFSPLTAMWRPAVEDGSVRPGAGDSAIGVGKCPATVETREGPSPTR